MKKIKIRLLSWLAIPALLFASCLMDVNYPEPGGGVEGGVDIKVIINMPQSIPQAYRASIDDENRVKEIDVLVFRAGSTPSGWRYDYRASGSAIQDMAQPDKKQFSVTMRGGSGQLVVVLANVAGEINALEPIATGADRDALLQRLVSSNANRWPSGESGTGDFRAFPMWGEKDGVNIDEQTVSIDNIKMMRAIARIDVLSGPAVVSAGDFQLKEVLVYNSKNKGYVVPGRDCLESDTKVDATTVPADPLTYESWNNGIGNPLLYNLPASASELLRTIYLYEAKATAEWEKATCLVVGGTYKGRPAYYRVDFIDGDNELLDILRNHLYRVTITGVNGPGSETPEEAFNAKKVEMAVQILPWNTGYMDDIIVSGQYYLKVIPSTLNISYNASIGNTFTVETNVNGWGVVGVTDSFIWEEGETLDENWITVAGGAAENRPAGTNTVQFSAAANGTTSERIAYIHIKAGRLLFSVTVTQNASVGVPKDESNCYMIDHNNPKPILIPVSQLRYAMGTVPGTEVSGFLGSDWIKDKSKLKVQILWSDINAFPPSEAAVVKDVAFLPDNTNIFDSKISVTPGSVQGNALVILYEDNNGTDGYQYNTTDAIRWSWHIWKSAYYPYNADGTPNGRASSPDATSLTNDNWMDRNLGAMSSVQGDFRSCGFYYSWGRKDPWPGPQSWNRYTNGTDYPNAIQYYASNAIISSFTQTNSPNQISLSNSVNTPMIRHYNTNSGSFFDWLTPGNIDLWGGGTNTPAFLHPNGKSVYDPCPEGYRVPKNGAWGSTPAWGSLTNQGRVNYSFGGYYPCGGYMRSASGTNPPTGAAYAGSLIFLGSQSYYWSATPSGNYARGFINYAMDTNSPGRAQSYSVRCIKE